MKKIEVKEFGKVAVLMGGNSAEREVSLDTGKIVLEALKRQGVDAHGIDVGDDIVDRLWKGQFNSAFIALHGRGGEDGVIQSILEKLHIAYPGSGIEASALSMDKAKTKEILQKNNIPTTPFIVLRSEDDLPIVKDKFDLPICVKPVQEGSSNGVAKVGDFAQLFTAYQRAFNYDDEVLVEPWIVGREFTVAVLDESALPVVEICVPGDGFYDYDAKYESEKTVYHCPCDLPKKQEVYLQALALRAFKALGCEGWGRVDFLQDEQENFWVMEVNTVPGMTAHSLLPKAAAVNGIDFDQLVLRILSSVRYRGKAEVQI
jgi:D-alanine-D-alanine ligase